VSCKDLRNGSDEPASSMPTEGPWSLSTVWRITDDDGNGAATVIDWPAELGDLEAENGRISEKGELLTLQGVGFSPCAQVELLSVKLLDPLAEIFATPGSAGVPLN
jgi:hypothetical protein